MPDKLGFIGLGIMGRPMALNLRRSGAELFVFARRAESLVPLTAAGAIACASPADVGYQADIVFTMVSDTSDVEQLLLGSSGVIEGVRPGAVVVDMSTISPAATRRIAARLGELGVEMLDAPVSGGERGAIDGTLSIMVGGSPEAFERVRPWFERMGRGILHIGESGAGQVCKACNQVVIGHTLAGVGEALLLARASGVDPARVREALLGGFAQSRVLEVHGRRMLQGDYAPGFKASLHQKDMRIVLETAAQIGIALPGAAVFAQYVNALVGRGLGELDSAAIHQVQIDMCGPREP
ncbi:MAG: NAD(P)-dependent oxidoreductase [Chromatiaceae bacterium]|jgi:2-hydroxy-3-oxopropionate reductase|nr:NAD(P)-dependent oxidoreductase [Chromatiaceae bacterium]